MRSYTTDRSQPVAPPSPAELWLSVIQSIRDGLAELASR
jgi:hypothetical protein